MALIENVTVNWISPRIITIPVPIIDISIDDLNDTLQNIEDSEEGIAHPTLRAASGKDELGGGLFIGLTIKLLNAKVKFADRTTSWIVCNVGGGNLLAVDVNNVFMNPIEPSSYVTVTKTSAVSAALLAAAEEGITWEDINSEHITPGTMGGLMNKIYQEVRSFSYVPMVHSSSSTFSTEEKDKLFKILTYLMDKIREGQPASGLTEGIQELKELIKKDGKGKASTDLIKKSLAESKQFMKEVSEVLVTFADKNQSVSKEIDWSEVKELRRRQDVLIGLVEKQKQEFEDLSPIILKALPREAIEELLNEARITT